MAQFPILSAEFSPEGAAPMDSSCLPEQLEGVAWEELLAQGIQLGGFSLGSGTHFFHLTH